MIVSSTLELNNQKFDVGSKNETIIKPIDKYSLRYRILKTILLITAWISFGMNKEIIGSTLEDLRIYLKLNYNGISFGLVIRNLGTLFMMLFSGYLYDKLTNYADLLMAISGLFLAFRMIYFQIKRNLFN